MKDLIKKISDGAATHGGIPFWSWNDKLDCEELRAQIRNMKSIGMAGFFMHARTGLETEYMSDDWFHCVDVCIDEAKKQGMQAWSYDENGWPSGFAGGKLLEDPKNFAAYVKIERGAFPSGGDILGVYTLNDGKLTKISAENSSESYITVYRCYDRSYVDTLDAAVIKKFIDSTYEEYRKRTGADFGGAMPGFFTDEPQYFRWATPWSDTLPKLFSERFGYDITSALPALFIDFDSSDTVSADEFRYDYHRLIHELFINNYQKQIYDWCEEHGAQITGHAVEETFLGGQMWCCGGVMPFYQYEHIPGMDYLGRGITSDLAPKQLGSVCAQTGRKKVLSEMFACCGWDVSPVELKRIAELQYAGGVNMMCTHLYPYSIRGQRKRDYPAFYSEHLPWQSALADFDRYFNNLGYTLSLGEEIANTLIIHPMHSAYLGYKRDSDRASIAELEDKLNEIVDLFSGNQIPYHFGDEWMMSSLASVEDGKMRVGKCVYDYVVIPRAYTLDSSTVALLDKYVACGGKLWLYDAAPDHMDGRKCDLSRFKSNISFDDIMNARPAVLIYNGSRAATLRTMSRDTEFGRVTFITNITPDTLYNVRADIQGVKNLAICDMSALTVGSVRGMKTASGVSVKLDFEPSQSYVLIEDATAMDDFGRDDSSAQAISLDGEFRFKTMPENAYTLDYASYSLNGEKFSPVYPLVAIKDTLLSQRAKGELAMKFSFEIETLPQSLSIVAEPMKYSLCEVNGHSFTLDGKARFDRSFKSADILPFVHIGTNEVVFSFDYFQRDYVYDVLYGNVTESLRNCLSFDTEVECVYLVGKFALKCDRSRFTPSERSSVCYDGGFAIAQQKDTIDVTDVVCDGYPFFGGEMTVSTTVDYKAGGAHTLALGGRFAICDVSVNGANAGKMMFSHTLDIEKYLREGENEITLTLHNANRNLMGPHHRHDPEPWGVGPNTFSFENEWHDFKCAGYTDRYAFVRFGIDR